MKWNFISKTKKGLIIGLVIGIIFGIYSNITDCHTSPGGPVGCDNRIQLLVAVLEFFFRIPLLILPYSAINVSVIYFISPVIFCSLIGMLIGYIYEKAENLPQS